MNQTSEQIFSITIIPSEIILPFLRRRKFLSRETNISTTDSSRKKKINLQNNALFARRSSIVKIIRRVRGYGFDGYYSPGTRERESLASKGGSKTGELRRIEASATACRKILMPSPIQLEQSLAGLETI